MPRIKKYKWADNAGVAYQSIPQLRNETSGLCPTESYRKKRIRALITTAKRAIKKSRSDENMAYALANITTGYKHLQRAKHNCAVRRCQQAVKDQLVDRFGICMRILNPEAE